MPSDIREQSNIADITASLAHARLLRAETVGSNVRYTLSAATKVHYPAATLAFIGAAFASWIHDSDSIRLGHQNVPTFCDRFGELYELFAPRRKESYF